MKVLLLGSGGREHALAWKIAQSPKIEKLYIAPGNAGTSAVGENVAIKATDFPALINDVVRLCDIYNIPLATNLASAELLIKALDRGDMEWREVVR